MRTPIAIDPPGCGCTECLTGLYIPLDQATPEQVLDMLAGKLANHTSDVFTVITTVKAEYLDRTWTFDHAVVAQ